MKSWVMKVAQGGREPFWLGNFYADSRAQAKIEARKMLARHMDGRIVCIAEGHISITVSGPDIPWTDD